MVESYEIVVLILCILFSGFYSGSEAVLMSIGIDRAKQLIEEGGTKGRAMEFMAGRPNELLTTILIGNNVANILIASLTTSILSRFFPDDVVSISVAITTIVILIFGEIIPKAFARTHAESLAVTVIRVLQGSYYTLFPAVKATAWLISKVLGKNAQIRGRVITRDDIEFLINKAEKEKTMDSKQIELITSILEFPTIKVKDIMIPRTKVKYIQEKASFTDIINFIREDAHSRYPVCSGELESTIGFLHVKDLAFVRGKERNNFSIRRNLKKPFFVYEHMKIQAVFDHMNRKKVHLALVKDENGVVVGIVTLEDIVEEIFGEIHDEHDTDVLEEGNIPEDEEEGVLLEGSISLRDLYNNYDVKIPLNDNYSTLAGFILDMLGNNFPEEGQIIVWEGLSFELEKVQEHVIQEVRITDVDGEKHLFSKKEAGEAQRDD